MKLARCLIVAGVAVFLSAGSAQASEKPEFSFSFLGFHKKLEKYRPKIEKLSRYYGIDPDLALAIAMYESGGNEGLVSHAGARGIMQVMPSTKDSMQLDDDIEAGIKYLSRLKKIFGDQSSKIIAAYNGGPGAVRRDRLRLETIQYLQGVSMYHHLLKQYRKEIDKEAADLKIVEIKNETWRDVSIRFRVSILELRMYNPFLAHRGELKMGARVVAPKISRLGIKKENNELIYIARLGDEQHLLANVFDVSYDEFRRRNHLFLYGAVYPGIVIRAIAREYLLSGWPVNNKK
ncbi:MAG: transglycosylase SLT domain-containing protein [Candidatus Niyogibacteria bacterium]|nr:MAG: transglycosylase SLT domain-containing protein [Candidatus Niyogibacteria bacterium]